MFKTGNEKELLVTMEIIGLKGKFTVEKVVEKLKEKAKDLFASFTELCEFVAEKMNQMSEYGLIGRTDCYYYSLT